MARLIDQELIDTLEVSRQPTRPKCNQLAYDSAFAAASLQDLRSELENLISINNDIRCERIQRRDTKAEKKMETMSKMSTTMTKSIFSETKNASFLNQELAMFIDSLQQKATESGLKEDALIPKESKKDRRIYENLKQMRP